MHVISLCFRHEHLSSELEKLKVSAKRNYFKVFDLEMVTRSLATFLRLNFQISKVENVSCILHYSPGKIFSSIQNLHRETFATKLHN